MKARGILARASVLCAVSALAACATAPNNARNATMPAPVPVATAQVQQPTIIPASSDLTRITGALNVSVRKINETGRPSAALLASTSVNPQTVLISRRLQCVPFARERSGVAIRGNANTWWNQAAGDFVRVKQPVIGSVMVMNTRRGHVGVVTKIIDSRHVVIDHSNWLSNGQIYLDQPVRDVSPNNDWSKVVVWHPNLQQFGKRALAVPGFIVDAPARGNATVYASLADVPANLAGDIQYAKATVAPSTTPAAPVLVATKPAVEAPVVMAAAHPGAKPASLGGAPAPMTLASAEQIAAAEAAPAPVAAKPVYVDTIVPKAKPGALSAPALVAANEPAPAAAAKPVYVATIVPKAKPSVLGGAAVAVVKKGETPANSDAAFVPSGKPESVATFR